MTGHTHPTARHRALAAALAAGGLLVAGIATAPPAAADVLITVTSTTDGGPGSLRAAIDTANASAQPVTIELAAATTYDLTTCAALTEDANVSGDLDLTGTQPVTIHGNGATIHQTCTGERVLHTLTGSGGLTIQSATITGGRGETGIAIWANASLSLEHTAVSDAVGSSNPTDASAAAVRTGGSGSLSIATSTISGTVNGAGIADLQINGTFTVSGTTVSDNGAGLGVSLYNLYAGGIVGGSRDLTISDSTASGNNLSNGPIPPPSWPAGVGVNGYAGGISMVGANGSGTHGLHATRLTVQGNVGGRMGGLVAVPLELHDSAVDGNWGAAVGGLAGGSGMVLDGVRLTNNHASIGVGGFDGAGTVDRSIIAGNSSSVGAGLVDYGSMTISRTTITGNSGNVGGLVTYESPGSPRLDLRLDHVTLVGNTSTGGVGSEVQLASGIPGSLELTASIVGAPNEPGPVCQTNGKPTASGGANVVGDTSCLATPLATDATGVDPELAPLADNGGPTQTRLPKAGSPAVDRQPTSDAGCADADQRGVARPQGPGCDAGAVEAVKAGYHPVTPQRIFDTRDGTGTTKVPLGPGEIRTLEVHATSPVPQQHVSAVVLNVTADRPTQDSHLSLWPAGQPDPGTSNLNFAPGRTIANLVTVPLGDTRDVQIRNNRGDVEVIVDLAGWYDDGLADPTSPAVGPAPAPCPCGDGLTPITPARVLDTRPGTTVGGPATPFGPGEERTVAVAGVAGIPADADAVVVNLTVTGTTAASHLTAWPDGGTAPDVSNLNWPVGDTIANLAIVKVGTGGTIRLRNNSGQAQVLADVAGWFRGGLGSSRFTPTHPTRILDTRGGGVVSPTRFGPGEARTVPAHVPAGATAVVLNLTGVFATATTHLTAWPAGQPLPTASNLNLPSGVVRPNAATTGLSPAGAFALRNNSGTIDVVADAFGYYG